jgi:two-component sensor histidine kinase
VNELVTNACKYAFPQGRAGEIKISFIDTGEGWKLTVHDNGVGMPADFEVHNPSSLGMRLIHSFAAQLGAAVTYKTNGGTLVEVMSAFGAHRPNPT